MQYSANDHDQLAWQLDLLRRWMALLAIVLLAVTWRLWWGGSEFPAIPVGAWLNRLPWIVDRASGIALCAGLILVVIGNVRCSHWGWTVVLVSGVLLALLDQHRWQPWFYQLLLVAAVFRLSSPPRIIHLLTWLTLSIYFYSALGKFDAEFLHTVGQQFWQGLVQLCGLSQPAHEARAEQPILLIALLPAVELLLVAGLAWPLSRRAAGVLAIGFHVGLMLLLGPLGINHSAGVVLWNLQFAGQALCLFVLADRTHNPQPLLPSSANSRIVWQDYLATAIIWLAIALPVAERWGGWDHWTSWALYAPHSSRTEVWIASTAVDRLPRSLQRVIKVQQAEQAKWKLAEQRGHADENTALWLRVPIERWSLEQTATPIYPQARFQLGVARALAARIDSEFKIKVIVRGIAARWDGRRPSREFQGTSGLAKAARAFWLGTTPRIASGRMR